MDCTGSCTFQISDARRVWGQDNSGSSGPVRTYVKRLCRKLGDDPDDPAYIFTKRRVGYWMEKGGTQERKKL